MTILLIAPVSAYDDSLLYEDWNNLDDEDILYDDYNDVNYVDMDYSLNNDDNLFDNFIFGDSVDIYFGPESFEVSTNLGSDIDFDLSNEILSYLNKNLHNSSINVSTIKENIGEICYSYGLSDCTVNIDSFIGPDQIPLIFWAHGTSMLPTIHDGQYILVNKTHDIHVGDIVDVSSIEHGEICKRVAKIDGNNVYVVSDNKNITYEIIGDKIYESKGLCTWVDISEIEGVVIEY